MIKKVLLLLFAIILSGCVNNGVLKLKSKEPIIVEHGDFISANPANYLINDIDEEILNKTIFSLKDTTKNDFKEIILNYKIDENNQIVKSMDGNCPTVGTYNFFLIYDDKEVKELKVEVRDTIPPIFAVLTNTITIIQDTAKVDYQRYFICEDLNGCKVEVDDSTVDMTKIGVYPMKVYAYDRYGNKTEEEVKVKITDFYETTDDMISPYLDF